METIAIIIKDPQESPKHMDVEPTLKNFQKLVGGLIEHIPGDTVGLPDGIDIFCNENGKNFDMGLNLHLGWDIIAGPCYFVSHDEEGRTLGLTKDQQSTVLQWIRNRHVDKEGRIHG